MPDFNRTLETLDGLTYFVTTCHDCGAIFRSRTIGRMPEWEHEHEMKCPALVLTED